MRAIERTNSYSENGDITKYQHSYRYDRITAACKRHPVGACSMILDGNKQSATPLCLCAARLIRFSDLAPACGSCFALHIEQFENVQLGTVDGCAPSRLIVYLW